MSKRLIKCAGYCTDGCQWETCGHLDGADKGDFFCSRFGKAVYGMRSCDECNIIHGYDGSGPAYLSRSPSKFFDLLAEPMTYPALWTVLLVISSPLILAWLIIAFIYFAIAGVLRLPWTISEELKLRASIAKDYEIYKATAAMTGRSE